MRRRVVPYEETLSPILYGLGVPGINLRRCKGSKVSDVTFGTAPFRYDPGLRGTRLVSALDGLQYKAVFGGRKQVRVHPKCGYRWAGHRVMWGNVGVSW